MPASIKKSRSTDKTIVVLNGRIKVGEVVGKDIILTGGHSGADLYFVEKLAAKEGLKIKYTHGGARPGAGAPKKDPTTTLAYRVPAAIAEPLDKRIREVIADFKAEKPPDPLSEISRKIISAHLAKETAEVRKLKKQKK